MLETDDKRHDNSYLVRAKSVDPKIHLINMLYRHRMLKSERLSSKF